MSVGPGLVVPVPFWSTSDARPDAVFAASAGGLATFSGAGMGAKAGGFCCAATVALIAMATARAQRDFIILPSCLRSAAQVKFQRALAAGVEAAVGHRAVNAEEFPSELRRR